jgi:hypothetical protein
MSELLNNIKRFALFLLSTTPDLPPRSIKLYAWDYAFMSRVMGGQERRGVEEPEKDWHRWGALSGNYSRDEIDEYCAFTVAEPLALGRNSM